MTLDDNKALVRRLFDEAWNRRNVAVLDTLVAPEYRAHPLVMPPLGLATGSGSRATAGPAVARDTVVQWLTAFPDGQVGVEDMLAEDDRVATRHVLRGTHRGPLWGLPPTGQAITLEVLSFWRIAGGQIAESWELYRTMSLLQQLGLLPDGGDPPADAVPEADAAPVVAEGLLLPPEAHKAVLRRYFEEAVNGQRLDVLDRVMGTVYTDHINGYRHDVERAEIQEVLAQWNIAFPTSHYTIEDMVAEEDRVAARLTWRAVHAGPFQGLEPSGNRVELAQMVVVRLADGLLTERWNLMDDMGLLQQLGVITLNSKDSKPGGGRPKPPADPNFGGKDLPK